MPYTDIYTDLYLSTYGLPTSSVYTTNYNPNPGFQEGMLGYASVANADISLDTSNRLFGPASLLVTCPGVIAGEGVTTPISMVANSSTGSASCYLNGVGTVTISVLVNGVVAATQHVMLTQTWVRTAISGITFPANSSVFLAIETTTANSAQFWLNGVQVEDTSPAHPYIDGDLPGGNWLSGFSGVSQQQYANSVVLVSSEITSSPIVHVLTTGESFLAVPLISAEHTYGNLVVSGSGGPLSAVTDFSVSALTDPDPAQTYTSWNNSGITMSGSWQQSWATFIPPQDYFVSNGTQLYKRAAYAALGWDFQAAATSNTATLTRAQAQLLPITTGFTAPSAPVFDSPRAIQSLIVANRINFLTNPSFEVSTANWSAVGTATLAQDSSVTVGEIGTFDDTIVTTGLFSMNVTLNSNSDGASTVIADLITGYTYIASAYVKAGPGLNNILMTIGSGSTSVQATGGTGYNFGAYNAGPYGGFNPTTDVPTTSWFRIWCIFTATSDSETLTITMAQATDVSYPTHMWIDAVLVEQGEILNGYFDGSSYGPNYLWDSQSGSAGLARSYFYDQRKVKQQAVLNVLSRHTPLGINYDTPLYAVPPIQ